MTLSPFEMNRRFVNWVLPEPVGLAMTAVKGCDVKLFYTIVTLPHSSI